MTLVLYYALLAELLMILLPCEEPFAAEICEVFQPRGDELTLSSMTSGKAVRLYLEEYFTV